MNTTALVQDLERRGVRNAETFLADFTAVAREALAAGDKIILTRFGAFSARQHAERMVANPRTGAPCIIPAQRVAHFAPGVYLRAAVNSEPGKGAWHGTD